MSNYSIVGNMTSTNQQFGSYVNRDMLLEAINAASLITDNEFERLLDTLPIDVARIINALRTKGPTLLQNVAFEIVSDTLSQFAFTGSNIIFAIAIDRPRANAAFEKEVMAGAFR